MSNKQKQWGAIIVMIALFAMIAFVTNLCSPMGVIVKNQFDCSNLLAMIGNYGNFGAYLLMGIPSGIMIKKLGYKKTALVGLLVGIVGILIQWASGWGGMAVYLIGALISGACMCILNTVVNPMLNILGGGGNTGNALIQTGGVFNSSAAVAVYIIMGALIGEASKANISKATPALFIALAIFVIAFIVIFFTKIEEPQQPVEEKAAEKDTHSAWSFRHFVLGALAIGIYGAIEMGPPGFILQYLTADTQEMVTAKKQILSEFAKDNDVDKATLAFLNPLQDKAKAENLLAVKAAYETANQKIEQVPDSMKAEVKNYISTKKKIAEKVEITPETVEAQTRGRGLDAGYAGTLGAIYFILMLVGRFVGASIGNKVSTKVMMTTVSVGSIILIAAGIFLPEGITMQVPGIDYVNLKLIYDNVPIGIFCFLLVGLCASVMWGGIFNLATEGLGKYTAMASGIFMTMVVGFAIMIAIQGWVADLTGNYLYSFFVPLAAGVYILWYSLLGSKNVNKDIKVD